MWIRIIIDLHWGIRSNLLPIDQQAASILQFELNIRLDIFEIDVILRFTFTTVRYALPERVNFGQSFFLANFKCFSFIKTYSLGIFVLEFSTQNDLESLSLTVI